MAQFKVTQAVSAAIRQIVEASKCYDVRTMRISRDGVVSARKDADKTFEGNDLRRYMVAHAADMVRQDGAVLEGW